MTPTFGALSQLACLGNLRLSRRAERTSSLASREVATTWRGGGQRVRGIVQPAPDPAHQGPISQYDGDRRHSTAMYCHRRRCSLRRRAQRFENDRSSRRPFVVSRTILMRRSWRVRTACPPGAVRVADAVAVRRSSLWDERRVRAAMSGLRRRRAGHTCAVCKSSRSVARSRTGPEDAPRGLQLLERSSCITAMHELRGRVLSSVGFVDREVRTDDV